ncbi:MAG: PD40 domain-containing protein [Anaerolineales bacterium]|nr:PD40 domain-containing protein [Anaerolineales bacterium]
MSEWRNEGKMTSPTAYVRYTDRHDPDPCTPDETLLMKTRLPAFVYILLLLLGLSLACQTTSLGSSQAVAAGQNSARAALAGAAPAGQLAIIGTDHNIYLMNPDGSGRTELTTDAGGDSQRSYHYITWAPDSRGLAFVQNDVVAGPGRGHIEASLWLADTASGRRTELFQSTDIIPFYLHFAPDSQTLAFLGQGSPPEPLGLYLISTVPGEPRVLENGQPFYWDWAPDSASLFVHTGGRRAGRLAFLDPAGSDSTALALQPTSFQAPAFLQNGQQLVVAIEQEGTDSLVLIDRDGAIVEELATLEATAAFVPAPTGQHIAYITSDLQLGAGAIGELALVEIGAGTDPRQIAAGPVVACFWSPDGQKLAYITLDPDGRQQTKLAQQGNSEIAFDLYVYELDSGRSRYLHSFAPTGEFLNVIPYFDQYHRSATIWSPDSRYLAISAQSLNIAGGEILLLDTDSEGLPQHLGDGLLAFWSWE